MFAVISKSAKIEQENKFSSFLLIEILMDLALLTGLYPAMNVTSTVLLQVLELLYLEQNCASVQVTQIC